MHFPGTRKKVPVFLDYYMIPKHPATKLNDLTTLTIMLVSEFLPVIFVIYWLLLQPEA